ncbi:MAG: CoA transferase [Microthrixaceae bacterium]|nr:CoA transferase [Microthrixaceae bacterium]
MDPTTTGPLGDLRVIDVATVIAGPGAARYLGDFGADVIKVERPGSGDTVRSLGWRDPRDGETLWWKLVSRNKRCISLDLKDPEDLEVMLDLCSTADVLVENFRPGTLERLGLGPEVLWERNAALVITRVTGFGQDGPYSDRPGFATQAEALSGYAAISGEVDGQPLLPPIALTDEVTALAAAFATMVALHSGVGQVVDVNLIESMLQMMGPLVALYGLTGEVQERLGAGIPYTVPRNTYRCSDGRWVAVSTTAASVAQRLMAVVGLEGESVATFEARQADRDRIDAAVAEWMSSRTGDEALEQLAAADVAAAPVYDMADIFADEHFEARGAIAEVDGVPMQQLIARLSVTPGAIRWAGRPLDADAGDIRTELSRRDGGGPHRC